MAQNSEEIYEYYREIDDITFFTPKKLIEKTVIKTMLEEKKAEDDRTRLKGIKKEGKELYFQLKCFTLNGILHILGEREYKLHYPKKSGDRYIAEKNSNSFQISGSALDPCLIIQMDNYNKEVVESFLNDIYS